jgi:hypothetical protein
LSALCKEIGEGQMNIRFLSYPELYNETPNLCLERRLVQFPPDVTIIETLARIPDLEYPYPAERFEATRTAFVAQIHDLNGNEAQPTTALPRPCS